MIQFINKVFRNQKDSLQSRRGQVGLILILIAAIALIFYAIVFNLGRASQIKTVAMIGANTAASSMASLMASYGERIMQETLGGVAEKCEKTSVWKALLTFIILVVIVIVLTIVAPGPGTALGLMLIGAAVGAVFAAVSLVLQMTVIQPGITSMWNKMFQDTLSITDQFIERGIQNALQAAVTDQMTIPDLTDIDTDGIFGDLTNPLDSRSAPDYVSRFGFYNVERLRGVPFPDTAAIQDFVDGLKDLIYGGGHPGDTDGWGLYDPIDCNIIGLGNHACCPVDPVATPAPAVCDPCCDGGTLPACCSQAPFCGTTANCAGRSPYGGYPLVHDDYLENFENNDLAQPGAFVSFREQIGKDDEHHLYRVDRNLPTGTDPQIFDNVNVGFFLDDASGFYIDPPYVPPNDNRPGTFPFFYKMADWGAQISALTYGGFECHLCDPDGLIGLCTVVLPAEIDPELQLPIVPGTPLQAQYSGGWCLDNVNDVSSGLPHPPQVADNVPNIPDIFALDTECARTDGGWKRGADMFCNNNWPYFAACPKNAGGCMEGSEPIDCECEDGLQPAEQFPEDNLDEFVYGLPEFIQWAETIVNIPVPQLAKDIEQWYPQAAEWIEPACPAPPCDGSFTQLARQGTLHKLRDQLIAFRDPVGAWLHPTVAYVGGSCDDPTDSVWCIPPEQIGLPNEYGLEECPGVSVKELATFDFNKDGFRGDLEDVVECLRFNADEVLTYSDGTTSADTGPGYEGNPGKFQECYDACVAGAYAFEKCASLPRSLIPAFNATYGAFDYGTHPDAPAFAACLGSTDVTQCDANCNNPIFFAPPYSISPFDAPDLPQITYLLDPGPAGAKQDCIDGGVGFTLPGACDADNPDGTDIICDSATLDDDLQECACSWEQDCSGWGCQWDQSWKNEVSAAMPVLGGYCDSPPDPLFLAAVSQSASEALNQRAKLKKRFDFLDGRFKEGTAMFDSFSRAITEFTDFLDADTPFSAPVPGPGQDSPSEKLINARKNNAATLSPSTASVSVYVWQDAPLTTPRANGSFQGYWHAVKVETRIPRRCNDSCGLVAGSPGAPDPGWPRVTTKVYRMGLKRCYRMSDTTGMVKARVVRFDEDKDPSGLKFPSGVSILDVRFSHPERGEASFGNLLTGACGQQIHPSLTTTDPFGNNYPWVGGFMLNRVPDWASTDADDIAYRQCWQQVHTGMLHFGVSSETCAQYYLGGGTLNGGPAGFRFRFIPCDAQFINGAN